MTEETGSTQTVMEAFIDAYMKKHPELTRDQAAQQIREQYS